MVILLVKSLLNLRGQEFMKWSDRDQNKNWLNGGVPRLVRYGLVEAADLKKLLIKYRLTDPI